MFHGTMFTPDRFIGGDDPATTIRALVLRDQGFSGANLRLINWLAACIQINGGALKLDKETLEALPNRFGIHHRHDATGAVILSVVPVTEEMFTEAMSEPSEEVTRANAKTETEPTDEELRNDGDESNNEASN